MDATKPASDAVTAWRGWLIAVGVLLLLVAAGTFLSEVTPDQYPGVALWLGAAIVLHDGVAAMAVFGVTVLARRASRRVPFVVLVIVQCALAVVAIVTIVVVPEIAKNIVGTANPSILPLDYGRNLLVFYAVAGVLTVAAVLVALIAGIRRSPRTR